MMRACAAALAGALLAAAPVSAQDANRFDTLIGDTKAVMLSDPAAAIVKAKEAGRVAESQPPGRRRALQIATARWLQGEAAIRIGDIPAAAPLIDTALRSVRSAAMSGKLEGDVLLSRGGIAVERGDVAGALSDYQAAHGVFVTAGDTRSQIKALIQIANLYYEANDWANALKYFEEALEGESIDPGLAVSIHNGRGVALKELGRHAQAEREFGRAVKIARQVASPLLTATVLNNAARNRLLAGKVASADRAVAESMRLTRTESPPGFLAQQLAIAAQVALQRGSYPRAAALIDQALTGTDLAKTTLADREAHRTGYEANRALGRADLALAHLTAWKRLDDAATQLARSNSAALMSARFDFANQELRIANLKAAALQKSVAIERARVARQRMVFAGAAAATVVVIALLAFGIVTLRRSRNQVRAANIDLGTTNVALERALAARTEFLATTSHEIRTPLNGILGMTQVMLADAEVAGDTRDRLDVVHGAGLTMLALVDDILDVAKMETGNLTVEHAPVDLHALLIDSCGMWEVQAAARGLIFTLDHADAPDRIVSDATRLRQVMFNLVSNALKFTTEGAVRVAVSGRGSGRLRIAVSDTGIGIPADKRQAIFEAFRQADAGTTRQFGGTGLGLTICRRIAEALGGGVEVDDAAGGGTCFVFDVPAQELAPSTAEDLVRIADAMLVVDRNPITRAMLKTLFAPRCPDILFAADADAAVAILRRGGVARVVIDDATVRTDGGDGLSRLAAAALVTGAETIALWAGDTAMPQLCGIDRIVAKPIAHKALVDAVLHPTIVSESVPLVSRAA